MNRKSIIGSRYEIIISLANAIYRNKWWIIIQHWNYSNFKTTAIKYSFCETIWLLLRKKKSKQKKEGETIERFKHEEHLKFHNSSRINTKFSQLLKTTVLNEKHIFFFIFFFFFHCYKFRVVMPRKHMIRIIDATQQNSITINGSAWTLEIDKI